MIKLTDILTKNRPLNIYENSINDCIIYSLITVAVTLISSIYILKEYGFKELISVISTVNAISVCFIIWLLILISMFMSGLIYVIRHNNAVKKGIRYSGTVTEHKQWCTGAKNPTKHRFEIRISNEKVVRTPVYVEVPNPFRYCDVYYYKKKYYFTEFYW